MSRTAACMLAVALLITAGCDDDPIQQPPPPTAQITVTTNKTHYAAGEPILVSVENEGQTPVWQWLYDCLPHFERQHQGRWEPEQILVCPAGWSLFQLDPGQSRETTWQTLSSGRYRVLVYTLDSPEVTPDAPAIHRSQPFAVD